MLLSEGYMTLEELYKIIEDRKRKMPENSYVASLFKKDKDSIIQKIGEESTELIIAAKGKSRQRIISETADLIFHLLVFLSSLNISLEDINQELKARNKNK